MNILNSYMPNRKTLTRVKL